MSAANLAVPLRTAIIGSSIASLLPAYHGSRTIFTRRPVPNDATYPLIAISPDVSVQDNDGINDYRPVQERDVVVYGRNEATDGSDYDLVEQIGYALRDLFHGNRQAITVAGWNVVQINARGPYTAPTDDDQTVGRVVSLVIELAKKV